MTIIIVIFISMPNDLGLQLNIIDRYNKLTQEKNNLLVIDWYKDYKPRERVKDAIRDSFDADLPDCYDKPTFQSKINLLLNHFIDMAVQGFGWISGTPA